MIQGNFVYKGKLTLLRVTFVGKGLCLRHPFIPRHSTFETFKIFINPGNLFSCPRGDLIKVEKAQRMKELFKLWANAADPP